MKFRIIPSIIISLILLICLSLLASLWLPLPRAFRLVFGVIYVLFIPGFIWSWIIWKSAELDLFSRLIISIVLSFVFVPLFAIVNNVFGVELILKNILLEVTVLLGLGMLLLYLKKYFHVKKIALLNEK